MTEYLVYAIMVPPINGQLNKRTKKVARFYANVKVTDVRQVEFEADENLTNDELQMLAIAAVDREWGSFDEYTIVELDYWGLPILN